MRPLQEDERRVAAVAARVISKAQEIGLADAPDKLVTPHAIQCLARAHLELLDRVGKLHHAVGDLEGLAALRRALAQSIQDYVDQIARVAIEGALREVARQQGGIATEQIVEEAKSEGLLEAKPFIGAYADVINTYVNTMPHARRHAFPDEGAKPRVVPAPTAPADIAKLTRAELLAIYCRVMRETEDVFVKYESCVVRVWDGMDGCWTDCTGSVGREEALRYWAEKTGGGVHHVNYEGIDYYRIFPGSTRMLWDGSPGGEMHR